jgi:hypothetical protein
MPYKDAVFWLGLTIFGVGLTALVDGGHALSSVVLMTIGLAAVGYSIVLHYKPQLPRLRIWVLLLAVTWCAIGYDFYDRHHTVPLPEFDSKRAAGLVISYAANQSTCYMRVDGAAVLLNKSVYRLAIGCFTWDGAEDILDAPNFQVSNLYDIKDSVINMQQDFSEGFKQQGTAKHANAIFIAVLLVPDGVERNQFSTLRQARKLKVLIPKISTVASQYP